MLARSERALPLAGRSYAPASQPECRPSVAWRVQAGRAKTVAGAARNATHVFLSYSAGADWTSREGAAAIDGVEETVDVSELYSHVRVTATARRLGQRPGLAADSSTGYDLSKHQVQREVLRQLETEQPEIVIMSPDCRR